MENILTGNMVSLEFCARQTDRFPVKYFIILDFKRFSWRVTRFWVCSKQATDSRIPGLSRKYGFFYELQDCINSKQYNRYQVCRRVLRFGLMPTINYKQVFFDLSFDKEGTCFSAVEGSRTPVTSLGSSGNSRYTTTASGFYLIPNPEFCQEKGWQTRREHGQSDKRFFLRVDGAV